MVSTNTSANRLLLRAEIHYDGQVTVTHTIELGEASALVQTATPPPCGELIQLKLSFPRLIAPVTLTGRVLSVHASQRPGDPPAMMVEFEDEAERARLRALLAPIAAEPTQTDADGQHHLADGNAYRVLVVEDNDMIRDMFSYGVRKYFQARHSRVAVDLAADGNEGWKMLRDGAYDLAIVDFYLPVLDGSKLVSLVRGDPRLQGLPVVAISVGGGEARDAMLQAGADLFLDKPIILRDLFATLEKLTAARVSL